MTGRVRGVVLLLILVIASTWLATEVARGHTMAFDLRVRDAIHQHAAPALTAIMLFATFIGRGYAVAPLTAVVFLLLWRRGNWYQARIFGIAMVGEPIIERGLKWTFRRARPQSFFDMALPSSYSFPSGHALAAVIFYGTLAALLTTQVESRWRKAVLWAAAVVMIATIGVSRIYLGVHYPTDVLAGYVIGLVWVVVVFMVLGRTV